MQDLVAAERYANALFEIAWRDRKDREFEQALVNFSEALRNSPDLERMLKNPAFGLSEKRNFLSRVYSAKTEVDGVLLNFFMMLLEKNRFDLVHEVAEIFKKIADRAQGEGTAEIRSAVPLEPASEASIVSRLEKIAGTKLNIKKAVDPSLLGGVIVKMDYKILDGSVANQIHRMKDLLMAKSSI